jgi:hypothetical protein
MLLLLPLVGCHSLILVNVGLANKAAAAQSVPMPAQAYCMALAAPDIDILGHRTRPPDLSAEQKSFCDEVKKGTAK